MLLGADVPDIILGANVTATVLNFFEVLLSWPIPGNNNNAITGYTVHLQKLGNVKINSIVGSEDSSAILQVDPGFEYSVRVSATNDVGTNMDNSQDTVRTFFSVTSGQLLSAAMTSFVCVCVC